MSKSVTRHLRANTYGLIAIFIALGGSAIAANQAVKNSVTSKSIKNAHVKAKDLAPNAVRTSTVLDDSLTGADIQESTLEGLDGPAVPTGAAGGDLTGTFPNPSIAADAVDTAAVASGAVGSAEVIDNSLSGSDIAEGGLTIGGDLSGSVGAADVNAGAIGASEVGNRSLTLNDVAVADAALGNTGSGLTLAPGACANVTTALNGLQVGDLVIVVPRSTSTGIFTPPVRVTTAGQFPLRMCNHSTGNVTNASANVDVFAMRP